MARGTLKLFEPLPPLDVKELFEEAEAEYTRVLAIFKSKQEYTEWWERTSVRQWMSFFNFSRKNNIPVTLHTLRMIRATLLYDTIAVRICKEVDRFDEYLRFKKFRESQAKARVTKNLKEQLTNGLDDSAFLWLEEASKMSEKLMYRVQTMLDTPIFNFSSLIGKGVFAATQLIKFIGQVLLVSLVGVVIAGISYFLKGEPVELLSIINATLASRVYLVAVVILTLSTIRHISFRMHEQDS
jgi:hypothetical protein